MTALGDIVNVTARLASAAGTGEILVNDQAAERAGLETGSLELRRLELKGKTQRHRLRCPRRTGRDGLINDHDRPDPEEPSRQQRS